MRPELLSFVILTSAVVAVSLLMLADQKGWRSPLPGLHLNPRWWVAVYAVAALLVVLQALQLGGVL
jgi:hypothetical protein